MELPRRLTLIVAGLLCVGVLQAQVPVGRGQAPVRAQELRRQIEERFAAQLRAQLGLDDAQYSRLRALMAVHAQRRAVLEAEEQALRAALQGQLRPGIAADPDSVTKLVDRLSAVRVSYAQTIQDEMRELQSVLTPVQRGQLFLLRDRLLQEVAEQRLQARLRAGGVRPPR
jgi:hypothetical protein